MKLIDPEAGDYIDRYTILQLKIRHDHLSTALVVESEGIQRAAPWIDMRLELIVQIATVNTLLWVVTDEFDKAVAVGDDVARCDDYNIARIARKMRRLNRQRAELVAELSGLDGAMDEDAKEEDDV